MAKNSDWFIALFTPVVIGPRNYYGIGFFTVFENRSKRFDWCYKLTKCTGVRPSVVRVKSMAL